MGLFSTVLLPIAVLSLIFLWIKSVINDPLKNFKGPSAIFKLPLIGHGYLLGTDLFKNLFKYKEKYGDVFRLDVGNLPAVWISDYDLIIEGTKSPTMTDRHVELTPSLKFVFPVDAKGKTMGMAAANKERWNLQRKFGVKNLISIGMNDPTVVESVILHEYKTVYKRLKSLKNSSVDLRGFFLLAINNGLWGLMTGERSESQEESNLMELTQGMAKFLQKMAPCTIANILQMNSVFIIKLMQFMGLTNLKDLSNTFTKQILETVKDKESDPNGNFIERCWAEVKKHANDKSSPFYGTSENDQMVGQLFDVFLASTETQSTFFEWFFLFMIANPDVQEKAYQEIIANTDPGSPVSYSDLPKLNYFNAILEEVCRMSFETGTSVPRMTNADTKLGDHVIPNGTVVFFFTGAVCMNEKLFPEPTKFKPERFLDQAGNFARDKHILFFGYGNRQCPGEKMARMQMFLMLSNILKDFRFSKADRSKPLDFVPVPGVMFYPQSYKVMVTDRT